MAGGERNVCIILMGDIWETATWKMGQWNEGMMLNVREAGGEIDGAGNWNMLMDNM